MFGQIKPKSHTMPLDEGIFSPNYEMKLLKKEEEQILLMLKKNLKRQLALENRESTKKHDSKKSDSK